LYQVFPVIGVVDFSKLRIKPVVIDYPAEVGGSIGVTQIKKTDDRKRFKCEPLTSTAKYFPEFLNGFDTNVGVKSMYVIEGFDIAYGVGPDPLVRILIFGSGAVHKVSFDIFRLGPPDIFSPSIIRINSQTGFDNDLIGDIYRSIHVPKSP